MGINEYRSQIKGVMKRVNKVLDRTILAGALLAAGLAGFHYQNNSIIKNSQRIETVSQLEKEVEQEKTKLGIVDSEVSVEFYDNTKHQEVKSGGKPTSYASTQDGKKFKIVLADNQHNTGILRHELYHTKHDCKEGRIVLSERYSNPLKKYVDTFVEEFKADLYAARGIDLK
ncbi:hypothetical protein KA107_01805 [Candidatus Pacearchaeota archaeon]|nr:hypothetical protein [Candidatus Pacearchaeota archaeon]